MITTPTNRKPASNAISLVASCLRPDGFVVVFTEALRERANVRAAILPYLRLKVKVALNLRNHFFVGCDAG